MRKKSTRANITGIIIIIIIVTAYLLHSQYLNQVISETYRYSFEKTRQNWTSHGIDLDNPAINWSINRSSQHAYTGNYSMWLFLNNLNDAGKIWIQHSYMVKPNSLYRVNVSYRFATADYGDINLFTIITGVSTDEPSAAEELQYQDDTRHHQNVTNEFIWLTKSYTFSITSDIDGRLYVSIGVWGTWETARLYFIDDIVITVTGSRLLAD